MRLRVVPFRKLFVIEAAIHLAEGPPAGCLWEFRR
jgi:hypothetical protein